MEDSQSDPILKNVFRHISLDKDEINYFLSSLQYKEVPKKTILLREGQTCNYLLYVQSGILRYYHIDRHGKESTIMFAVDDWWITDMYCFLNNKPALMFIETVSDSFIYQLSKDDFEKLFSNIPQFERFFRILMQNAYTREQLRVIDNLSLSAEERYNSFLKKYPDVAKIVTQKQIAYYLGITPEFLSSLRREKAKKRNLNLS